MIPRARHLLVATLLVLAGFPGCVAFREHTLGIAIWPFVLGTDVQIEELASVRGVEVVVALVEVSEDWEFESYPVAGADVHVSGPGFSQVALNEWSEGLYAITTLEALEMSYQPGEEYFVDAVVDGETYSASAAAASPLDTGLVLDTHELGSDLVIQFPEGYQEEYDQVLARVSTASGDETWSNHPSTAQGWLEFAASTFTPVQLGVPGAAFPDAESLYGVALLGAVRSRTEASFSDNLTSELSGFTTGSGFALPIVTGE